MSQQVALFLTILMVEKIQALVTARAVASLLKVGYCPRMFPTMRWSNALSRPVLSRTLSQVSTR